MDPQVRHATDAEVEIITAVLNAIDGTKPFWLNPEFSRVNDAEWAKRVNAENHAYAEGVNDTEEAVVKALRDLGFKIELKDDDGPDDADESDPEEAIVQP